MTSANIVAVDATLIVAFTTTASQSIGTITYSVLNGTGSVLINKNTGSMIGTQVGVLTVTVTSSGNTNYVPTTTNQRITVVKGAPTLTITSSNMLKNMGTFLFAFVAFTIIILILFILRRVV